MTEERSESVGKKKYVALGVILGQNRLGLTESAMVTLARLWEEFCKDCGCRLSLLGGVCHCENDE